MENPRRVPTTFNKEDVRMKEQTRDMFSVLWVAAAMLFIGLVPQLRAE